MKKLAPQLKVVICFIFIFIPIIFITLLGVLFNGEDPVRPVSNSYTISDYDVSCVVKKDGTMIVTEEITAHFSNLLKHGIYRYLPKKQNIIFSENGKTYNKNYENEYSIYGTSSHLYETYDEGGNFVIRFGSEYNYVNPTEVYRFSYKMVPGDDRIADFDQLYYNILGDGWDTTIANFSAIIEFEKDIDGSAWVYVGAGETEGDEISFVDNKIQISYSGTLDAFVPITVRKTLPADFFGYKKPSLIIDFGILAGALLIFVICVVYYTKKNNFNEAVPVVSFEAPDGINPAEAGYLIDKYIDKSDFSSLIVYWASKGYLSIEEKDGHTYVKKIVDLKCDDKIEKDVFVGLFKSGDCVDIDTLSVNFGKVLFEAKKQFKQIEDKKYFSSKAQALRSVLMLVASLFIVIPVAFMVSRTKFSLLPIGIMAVGLFFFYELVGASILTAKDRKPTLNKTVHFVSQWIVPLLGLGLYILLVTQLFEAYCDPTGILFSFPLLAVILMAIAREINIRNNEGNRLLGQVEGLRQFILVAEQDRIKMLAKENPKMFYDVLPFAYVLGVSNVWIKKFESINVPAPEWYTGNNNLADIYWTTHILNSMNRTANSFATSSTAYLGSMSGKSGGGSGFGGGGGFGGGFGGGGHGGGGGGSW